MKHTFILFILCAVGVFSSCESDNEGLANPQPVEEVTHDYNDHQDADRPELHDALLAHIQSQTEDYSNPIRQEVTRPDGTVETVYVVSDDIEMTKEQLKLYQSFSGDDEKQYRTNNRVTKRTIKILGSTGGSDGLNAEQQRGLRYAVANYNALNLTIDLELEFGNKSWWNNLFYDIVVYRDDSESTAGGRAGFPYNNGNPYKWVRIFTGMDNEDSQANEHVIGHEIGHCLGLRHTDFFDRSSCNRGFSNEGQSSSGAQRIPGTPAGYDTDSQMNACWPSDTDGEFSYYDRVALRWLF
ncbi:M57 family metalloprotease [Lewinella sp. 4G2]|uniref:M57 family metalloprotease n=1 Tax=Lewinella sp. 4G2 TaxID=1803372 RepID=UPI0007B4C04E|nr:M57 family metalloprotease [Lewinella sp. 4G2]OAV42853.1 hypothetical protein A3850_016630 [Lewinella sp. 4G2]